MHQDYSGKETLEYLKEAVNYNRFLELELLNFIEGHEEALDFGAGNGEFPLRLRNHNKRIIAVEQDAYLREAMTAKGLHVAADLSDIAPQQRIYTQNVLEHIEDDEASLRALYAVLEVGGKLFVYVPAFLVLYTDFDKAVGHFRRYRKRELMAKLTRAGFVVERAEYVDAIGFLGWLLMGQLPGNKAQLNPMMIKIFDRILFPASRMLDAVTKPFFGKNLLVIAKK